MSDSELHKKIQAVIKRHSSKHSVKSKFRRFGRTVGRGIGRFAKSYVRSGGLTRDAGMYGGPMAGAFMRGVTGHGDYHLHKKHDTRYGAHIHEGGHMGHSKKSHSIREKGEMSICHSEYLGELITGNNEANGPSAFLSQNYPINPGNMATFPWLSTVANNFQDYKFRKLIFEFRPLCSESTSTTSGSLQSMGSVIIATQYDSTSQPYPNKAQMENSDFAVSVKPSGKAMHAVECKAAMNPLGTLYVAAQLGTTANTSSSQGDIRFQNLGYVQFASVGCPILANTPISLGEIWVHFECDLLKPQLNGGLNSLVTGHYSNGAVSGQPTATKPFGNVTSVNQPLVGSGSILPLVFTGDTFKFPLAITEGSYLCTYTNQGSANVTLNVQAPVVLSGGTLSSFWQNDSQAYSLAPPNSTVTLNYTMSFIVKVDAPGALLCTVQMPTTVAPTLGRFDLMVTPYNSQIST